MVANVNSPNFSGGANIAIKCPYHTYEQTIAFYRDTLGLPLLEEEPEGCILQFGPVKLWIDRVPNISHPDIWLELETNDTEAAAAYLKNHGVPRRDEVEQLRESGRFRFDPIGEVRSIKTCDVATRISQFEMFDDVLADSFGSRGGERHDWNFGKIPS